MSAIAEVRSQKSEVQSAICNLKSDLGKEGPILFSAEMIRAMIAGRKTQTRRVIKFPKTFKCPVTKQRYPLPLQLWKPITLGGVGTFRIVKGQRVPVPEMPCMANEKGATVISCYYGVPGDRLWVRETFVIECEVEGEPPHADGRPLQREQWGGRLAPQWYQPHYRATDPDPELDMGDGSEPHTTWTPSIHMPRWASRLTLQISKVRVERIQQISEADAIAEGVEHFGGATNITPWRNYDMPAGYSGGRNFSIARRSFNSLWDSINAKRGFGWDGNPWVWVLDFQVVECKTGRPA